MTTTEEPRGKVAWYGISAADATRRMGVDPDQGLSTGEVERRLAEHGPNELPTEPQPSVWVVARGQLSNPMNIMLLIVCVASFATGQVATGVVVLGLVTFNVVMGSSQEMKARASVEALAQLQVPRARVQRSGLVEEVESIKLVPGDVVLLEAGDVVPADGRIVSSATLEVQEAALTGESAPVSKDAAILPEGEIALGDRTNLVPPNAPAHHCSASVETHSSTRPCLGLRPARQRMTCRHRVDPQEAVHLALDAGIGQRAGLVASGDGGRRHRARSPTSSASDRAATTMLGDATVGDDGSVIGDPRVGERLKLGAGDRPVTRSPARS